MSFRDVIKHEKLAKNFNECLSGIQPKVSKHLGKMDSMLTHVLPVIGRVNALARKRILVAEEAICSFLM